jgi:hypothetical protein
MLGRDMYLVYGARPRQLAVTVLLTMMFGAIPGFLYDDTLSPFKVSEWLWLSTLATGFLGTTGALAHVVEEKAVIHREVTAGISRSAFGLAKVLGILPLLCLNALVVTACTRVFTETQILTFGDVYAMQLLILLQSSGIGHIIATGVSDPAVAQRIAVLGGLMFPLLGGARPTLAELQAMSPVIDYLSYFSWSRHAFAGGWCTEAPIVAASYALPPTATADIFGHDCGSISADYSRHVLMPQILLSVGFFAVYVAMVMYSGRAIAN